MRRFLPSPSHPAPRRGVARLALGLALGGAALALGGCSDADGNARGGEVLAASAKALSAEAGAVGPSATDPRPAPAPVASEGPAPEKLALLVGIDRYAPDSPADLRPLTGCKADVRRARELLVDRFAFPAEEVLVLEDEQATVEGIVRVFVSHLVARAGPRTQVVFWFSGHGSRVPDEAPGRELDDMDSSLLAFDSRAGGRAGEYDLSDDLLASLRQALAARTPHVAFVTDACHSGSVLRSAGSRAPRVRSVGHGRRGPELERFRAFWPDWIPFLEDGDPRRTSEGYVHLSACSPRELAQELDLDDGRAHGAFSFFLADALERAEPGTSWSRVAEECAVRLATRVPGQTPWSEGELGRVLFGGRFLPRPPGHPARLAQDGTLLVQAGSLFGLQAGSELELFGDDPARAVGLARVRSTSAFSSVALLVEPAEDAREGLHERPLRARERSRPASRPALLVWSEDEALGRAATAGGWAELAPRERAEYALERDAQDGLLRLTTPDGLRLWREPAGARTPAERAQGLEELLRKESAHQALLALALAPGELPLSARFVPPDASELELYARKGYVDARVSGVGGEGWRGPPNAWTARGERPGAQEERKLAILEVKNEGRTEVWPAVLSLTEDRERNVIWPKLGRRDAVLAPGAVVRVPVGVVANADWPLERAMRDRYLVFATRQYADFWVFEEKASLTRGAPGAGLLPGPIAQALAGPTHRGVGRVETAQSSWGVIAVDLLVE